MEIVEGRTYKSSTGEKIGPMVWEGRWFYVEDKLGCWLRDGSYQDHWTRQHLGDLIAEWTDGPVRTVTRREVVAGSYGHVRVGRVVNIPDCTNPDIPPTVVVSLAMDDAEYSAGELRAAAAVLLELAGALSDGE